MDLLDANVLIGAFRPLTLGHQVTFPPSVEVAFLRVVTHPRIFRIPTPFQEAVEFLRLIQESGSFRFPGLDWWNPVAGKR